MEKTIFVFDVTISKSNSRQESINLIYDHITHIHYCYGDLSGKLIECETIIMKPSLDSIYHFLDILEYVRENFDTVVVSNIKSISIVNVYLSFLGENTLNDDILDHESIINKSPYSKSIISNTYILNTYYIQVKLIQENHISHNMVNLSMKTVVIDTRNKLTLSSIMATMSDTMTRLIS